MRAPLWHQPRCTNHILDDRKPAAFITAVAFTAYERYSRASRQLELRNTMSSAPWYDLRIARGMKAQLTNWHERQKAGEKPIGWKVGFGAPDVMEQLKITAPLVGHLTDRA